MDPPDTGIAVDVNTRGQLTLELKRARVKKKDLIVTDICPYTTLAKSIALPIEAYI